MKKILFLFMTLILSVALIGCSNNDSTTGESKDGTTEINFWTFEKLHAEYYKDAAESWNKENPDKKIKLIPTVIPFAQLYQKLTVALQSGKGAPDLVDVELGQTAMLLKGKKAPFEPLNSEIEPFKDKLVESRLVNFERDGNYYGLDYHVGTTVTYYNKEILEKAGIDYKNIKTWEDYVAAGKQVKEKTGVWMTEVETSSYFVFDSMVAQQKSDVIEDGKASLAAEKNVTALQLLHDMVYTDKIARKAVGTSLDNEEFFAEMNKGKVASVTMPAWYMSRLVNYMPDLSGKIAIAPMPVFNEGDYRSAGGGGTATMVTNQANNKEITKEFAVWSKADEKQAIKQWTVLGFDPVRWDVWESEELKADNKYTQYLGKDIFDTLTSIKDEITSVNKRAEISPKLSDYFINKVLPNVITKEKLTPEEGLKAADKELNK
ncbi:ABC transporter substrate-binding protein [Peribacillus psychrosaccharolyticus]|uniref:ABC transporter substrate-binding protein n=1 Tax=Peribacillus psychrosaccharolyticus TaxID=1407 RepID=UPI003D290E0F